MFCMAFCECQLVNPLAISACSVVEALFKIISRVVPGMIKADGLVWFCVNFRKVSEVSKFEVYPITCIDKQTNKSVRCDSFLFNTRFDTKILADSLVGFWGWLAIIIGFCIIIWISQARLCGGEGVSTAGL